MIYFISIYMKSSLKASYHYARYWLYEGGCALNRIRTQHDYTHAVIATNVHMDY